MQFNTRKDARDAGVKTYNTGKVCSNGHLSYRYVQSGACAECVNGSPIKVELNDAQLKAARLRALADQIESEAKERETENMIFEEKKRKAIELGLKELRENNARRDFLKLCRRKELAGKEERRRLKAQYKESERIRKVNEKQYALTADTSRKATLKSFIKFKEPVHITNVVNAKSLLMAYAIMRCEYVKESDLWPDRTPRHGLIYTLKSHPDDIPAIREQLGKWFTLTNDLIKNTVSMRIKELADKETLSAKLRNEKAIK